MRKQLSILVFLMILNICSFMYVKNNIRKANLIPTSYRCISLSIDNNIIQKIVELDDNYKITYETYYIYETDNSIFNRNHYVENHFYNLNNKDYIVSKHKYEYKNKDMFINDYIILNSNYMCAVNSYKLKED